MSKDKPEPEANQTKQIKLDAEIRLEIRDDVERRVKERVQGIEDNYVRLAKIIFGAIVLVNAVIVIALTLFGISTWNDAKEKFLNSTDVAKRTKEIGEFNNEATNILSQMNVTFSEYTNRLTEIKEKDDVITSEDLTNKLRNLDEKSAEAQKTLDQLKESYDFDIASHDLIEHPTTDKGLAFDQLVIIASHPGSPFAQRAKDILNREVSMHGGGLPLYEDWKPDNASTMTFEQARQNYQATKDLDRLKWIVFIGSNTNYNESKKISFLIKVFKENDNISHIVRAMTILDDEFHQGLDYYNMYKWCNENESKYPAN